MYPGQLQQMTRPNTVLSAPEIQDKAQKMSSLLMDDWVNGHNEDQRDSYMPTQIFSGAAGILGGLLGGGAAQGGNQVLQQANQQIMQAKADRHNQTKDAITGLQYLQNFVNNTSPEGQKAAASYIAAVKNQNDQINKQSQISATQQGKVDLLNFKKQGLDFKKQQEENKQNQLKLVNQLKQQGLDIDRQTLEDHHNIAAQRMANNLLITKIQAQMAQGKGDQQTASTLAGLLQRQQKMLTDLATKKAEMSSNGQPKYDSGKLDQLIQSISGQATPTAQVDLSGLMSPSDQSDMNDALDAAIKQTQSLPLPQAPQQAQPAAQAAQQPQSNPTADLSQKIQLISKKFKVDPATAMQMLKQKMAERGMLND
jgi:hypothetical protein